MIYPPSLDAIWQVFACACPRQFGATRKSGWRDLQPCAPYRRRRGDIGLIAVRGAPESGGQTGGKTCGIKIIINKQ
jgi:hypothetical protein